MIIYYLYIKTHRDTGLKYLGQTSSNPFKYRGSGKYWKHHLKVHGDNISTELIAAFDNKDDLCLAGQFWSEKWDIVKSKNWANLTEENGIGGSKICMKGRRNNPSGINQWSYKKTVFPYVY